MQTVDQLFGFNLPMDITHLQALLSVIFHSLDAYLMKMLNQLGIIITLFTFGQKCVILFGGCEEVFLDLQCLFQDEAYIYIF